MGSPWQHAAPAEYGGCRRGNPLRSGESRGTDGGFRRGLTGACFEGLLHFVIDADLQTIRIGCVLLV
jgi:hypothetical protein